MRCRNCGHLNPEQNRYCGMCGGALQPKPVEKARPAAEPASSLSLGDVPRESEEAQEPVVEPERSVAPWWEDEQSPVEQNASTSTEMKSAKPAPVETAAQVSTVAVDENGRKNKWVEGQPDDRAQELREPKRQINEEAPKKSDKWWVEDNGPTTVGGPSFLGLSSGESTGSGYSYLFQEEEERSHAGRWIVLVLLLIAAGVLYFKWQPIRDYVLTTAISHSKPSQPTAQQQPGTDQGSTTASSPGTTTLASSDTPSQPTITTEAPKPSKPAGNSLPNGDKDSTAAKADNAPAAKADNTAKTDNSAPAASKPDKASPAKAAVPEPSRPAVTDARPSAKSQPKQEAQPADDSADDSADNQAAPASRREPQANPGSELVTTGEKYLYGRGVARSCDQAVSYFNAAAAKQNPQAYSHLGALYATGECVPMDRATAYSYFRRAYAKEPSNHYFEQNLTMLWREMSPDERQRATGGRTSTF